MDVQRVRRHVPSYRELSMDYGQFMVDRRIIIKLA